MSVCLIDCLLVTLLKKLLKDFNDIFGIAQ